MSSIIDPIITANKNRKIAVVSLTFASGVQYASGTAAGLEQVQQALAWSLRGAGTTAANAALQVGSGVSTASIQNLYTQGATSRTNVPTDLAINGSGFFVVRDAQTNAEFLTRAGDFQLDASQRLVTPTSSVATILPSRSATVLISLACGTANTQRTLPKLCLA